MRAAFLLFVGLASSGAPALAKGRPAPAKPAPSAKATPPAATPKANTTGASLRSSGASSFGRADLVTCIQESVLGRKDEACRGKSNTKECIGLKRALEAAARRGECLKKDASEDGCQWWGSDGRTQPEWMSVAAGHLARFGGCLDRYYDTEGGTTYEKARADAAVAALIGGLPDGSGAFRLGEGDILRRTLEGETFGTIFLASPFRQDFTMLENYTMKDAADTPIPLPFVTESADANAWDEAHGANFARLAKEFVEEESVTATSSSLAPLAVMPAPAPKRELASTAAAPASPPPTRRPRALYSLNLDRTIFELVNDAYVRHAAALLGTDDFIRAQKTPAAKDYGDLLKRGEAL